MIVVVDAKGLIPFQSTWDNHRRVHRLIALLMISSRVLVIPINMYETLRLVRKIRDGLWNLFP